MSVGNHYVVYQFTFTLYFHTIVYPAITIKSIISTQTCFVLIIDLNFTVPQIKCLLGGSSEKGSHVYFLLIVTMVLLFWQQIVLLWHQVTMVASEQYLWQNNSITQKTCKRTTFFATAPWLVFYSRYWELQPCFSTLREEFSQTNVILQYKLLASILSAVCSVIQQW